MKSERSSPIPACLPSQYRHFGLTHRSLRLEAFEPILSSISSLNTKPHLKLFRKLERVLLTWLPPSTAANTCSSSLRSVREVSLCKSHQFLTNGPCYSHPSATFSFINCIIATYCFSLLWFICSAFNYQLFISPYRNKVKCNYLSAHMSCPFIYCQSAYNDLATKEKQTYSTTSPSPG